MIHHDFFVFLQVFWFFAVGAVLILYATTAGFDYGVTLMMPFLKKEEDRKVMLNVIGMTWDGNQTWLVFAGGALFVIWPAVYASVFSGLYAAMLCILWALFLRPPGFDYRSKIECAKWRTMWDWSLFISALVPVFIFGLLWGNLLHGVPFYFDPLFLRPMYAGNFAGLLNLPGWLCGIAALLMVLMHGAALLHRRTENGLKKRFGRLFLLFATLFLIVFTITGFVMGFVVHGYYLLHTPANALNHILNNVVSTERGGWILSYAKYPWKLAAPIIAYVAIIMAMSLIKVGKGFISFWLSAIGVAGIVATAGTALFPFVLPSSLKPNQSITVWNGTSTYYRLEVMFYVALVCLAVIFLYKIYAYRAVWHKKQTLNIKDIEENEHMTY